MSSKTKTTATKEEARPALVPKLRFPEFREALRWIGVRLGDIADIKTGPFGSTLHQSDYVSNGTPIVTVEHLSEGGLIHKNLPLVSGEDKQRLKSYILRPGDIVFSRVGSVDRNSLVRDEEDGWLFSGRLLRIRTSPTDLNPRFLSFYFQLETTKAKLRSVAVGQTMASLNTEILSDFRVLTATPAEQQKIAECLSSVDELIAAQARKLDALKTHKKGLMQQLFPREGETQPRLRFPEFQNAGEWETKRVDERGNVLAGKALAVNAPGPLRPYLRTKNVLDGAIDISDVLTMPMTDAEFNRFEVLDGDILLNEGQSLGLVGRASIYRGEFGQRCAMQNALLRFRAFPSTCPEFASQAFQQCQKDGTFAGIATQTTSVAHLGSSRFSALELAWPPSLAEQQRIADCLTSLDALITAETQKHEALKTHKKGLMQQLFPSPEEVAA